MFYRGDFMHVGGAEVAVGGDCLVCGVDGGDDGEDCLADLWFEGVCEEVG